MTPHIEAKENEIAKIVIMPGDPVRAKLIADKFLEDAKLVSNVRGMNTYTGTYKGTKVTIMPSGMGIPSMGIYSYELFKFYNVDKIINARISSKEEPSINFYLRETSEELNKHITIANIHCSDVFYEEDETLKKKLYDKYGCMACEMESFALFHNAKKFGKKAAQILTVTDNLITGERASSENRQNDVMTMIEIAMESVIKL